MIHMGLETQNDANRLIVTADLTDGLYETAYILFDKHIRTRMTLFREQIDGIGNFPSALYMPYHEGNSHISIEHGADELIATLHSSHGFDHDKKFNPTHLNRGAMSSFAYSLHRQWPTMFTTDNMLAEHFRYMERYEKQPDRPQQEAEIIRLPVFGRR